MPLINRFQILMTTGNTSDYNSTYNAAIHDPRDGTGGLEGDLAGYGEKGHSRTLPLGRGAGVA